MAFLSLQNIGKIYVGEGNATVGIRNVNLNFELGEFVAVTGKSGSGKSTLLNIISGMDSYEEGEMLVEGRPTSHYLQPDFEIYREKYISFIFQDYNIIDSFTVLQNVELALMHMKNKKQRRRRALELIDRVGLSSHVHQKGSHLSGGQKQRTVIARALAKDSPIILADEPCGNLDSATSKEIIDLLREVSREKLLIMVTHDFEDVREIATREIRIFDGKVESDRVLKSETAIRTPASSSDETEENSVHTWKKTLKDGIHLGRVTFFAKPKLSAFLCLLMILGILGMFFMTSFSASSIRQLLKKPTMFRPVDGRVVATRDDGIPLTNQQVLEIQKKYGAVSSLHYDFLLDRAYTGLTYKTQENVGYMWVDFACCKTDSAPDLGRYPEKSDEVLLRLPISCQKDFGKKQLTQDTVLLSRRILFRVVGVSYYADNNLQAECLMTEEGFRIATAVSGTESGNIQAQWPEMEEWNYGALEVFPSYLLKKGEYHMEGPGLHSWQEQIPGGKPPAMNVDLEIWADYDGMGNTEAYHAGLKLDPAHYVSRGVFQDPSSYLWSDTPNTVTRADILFISCEDYVNMYEQCSSQFYSQFSLLFADNREARAAADKMKQDGFIAVLSNTENTNHPEEILFSMVKSVFIMASWVLSLIFIAFFINLCSGKAISAFRTDMAIMRSMGIPAKVIRVSMYGRMLFCLVPALAVEILTGVFIFTSPVFNRIFGFLYPGEYAAIFIGILLISLRVTRKHLKNIFSTSVKKSLKGGAGHD